MKPLRSKLKAALTVAVLGMGAASFNACLLPVGSGTTPDGGLLTPYGDPPPKVKDYFVDNVMPLFTTYGCIACHNPSGPGYAGTGGANGGLLLTDSASAYNSLVGPQGLGEPSYEATLSTSVPALRVDPGFPDSSWLYLKVSATTANALYGARMPAGGNPLSANDLATILTWIQNGAKP